MSNFAEPKEVNALLRIMQDLMQDSKFAEFSVLEDQIPAQGGMSCGVYEAKQEGSDKRWALKIIDKELRNFNESEMHREGSRWRNKNIVRAVYTAELKGWQFILMDYHEVLRNFNSDGDPEETAILIGEDICEALSAFHCDDSIMGEDRQGVLIHGDVKPDNIFWDDKDGSTIFMLGDFGTARKKGESVYAYSRDYKAPEVENGACNVGPSADIFSLGLVMLWYVCGKNDEFIAGVREDIVNGKELRKPEQCSSYFWEVILHAANPDPEKRIQSAKSLLDELRAVPNRKLEDSQRKNNRLKKVTAIEGVVLAAAAFKGIYGVLNKKKEKQKQLENKEREEDTQKPAINYQEYNSFYVGEIKDGMPCGRGEFFYSDGSSMSGNWQPRETDNGTWGLGDEKLIIKGCQCDDKGFSGIIFIEALDKWKYEGEYKSGIYGTGRFQFKYENKLEIIEGNWSEVQDKKIGSDSIYTGMLCNDKLNGKGILQMPGVGSFNGIFLNGIQCCGTFRYDSGGIYDGEWKKIDDRVYKHGMGSLRFKDGSIYAGAFKKGRFEGFGEMKYSSGACYTGMWKEGKQNGDGSFTDSDGKTYTGKWEGGKLVEKG